MALLTPDDFHSVPVFTHPYDEFKWLLDAGTLLSPGLLLEFGVLRGRSINKMARLCPNLTFYGFDSFRGPPKDWDKGHSISPISRFDVGGKPPEAPSNVQFVIGYFEDTLPRWWAEHGGPVAFAHVDCDLYESAVTVLRETRTGLVPGTILRFDELCNWVRVFEKRDKGLLAWREHEWKALQEWLAEGHAVKPLCRGLTGAGTVMVVS